MRQIDQFVSCIHETRLNLQNKFIIFQKFLPSGRWSLVICYVSIKVWNEIAVHISNMKKENLTVKMDAASSFEILVPSEQTTLGYTQE
jgi:hypothetical protein